MLREWIRIGLLIALAFVCASGDTGRIAVGEAGRILTLSERPRLESRGEVARSVAALPAAAVAVREKAEADGTFARLVAASELERLAILQELSDDAESAATTLIDHTRELATEFSEEPGAMAAHVDALRALRYLREQSRSPDPAIDHELAEMLLASRDRDPENGYHALLLAERAVDSLRFGEARDALIEAARAERVDPDLRVRAQHVRESLRASGYPESRIDEMLVLGGYGVVPLRPGLTLDTLARDLGHRGGEALTQDDRAWVECWAAIAALGISIAKSSVVLEDAVDALRAEVRFLEEIADVAPGVVPRDSSDRRDTLEHRMRALGLDETLGVGSRASFPVNDFVTAAISQLDHSNREVERTRRLDDVAAAHAIVLVWAAMLLIVLVAARVIEYRDRRRLEATVKLPEFPFFCRAFSFVVPVAGVVFAAGSGLSPFDRGAGIERVLSGFAEPGLLLLALPLVSVSLLLLTGRMALRVRSRTSFAHGVANFASVGLSITLVLFAVTARSIAELRENRAQEVSLLRADRFSDAFAVRFGTGPS